MPTTITRTPWIDDDGTGTTGTIINNAVKTELYNQIDEGFAKLDAGSTGNLLVQGSIREYNRPQPQATPIAQPFNAADYFGTAPLVWTVVVANVSFNTYALVGKQMFWAVQIGNSQTTGTPSQSLNIRIPGGFTASLASMGNSAYSNLAGQIPTLMLYVAPGATSVQISRADGGAFPVGVFYVYFGMTLWIA